MEIKSTVANFSLDSKYGSFIAGEFQESTNGYIDAINASTGQILSKIARGGKEDIDRAVKAANESFESWARKPIEERAALLHKIADTLEEHQERLKVIECLDTGRPLHEFDLDYQLAVYQFRYFASAILTYEGIARPVQNGHLIVKNEPLGVCGQIIPWNVPMVAFKLAPALAAGNTIVLKPAEDASLSTMEFAKLLNDILPAGVVNIVPGYGSEAGQSLVDHPDIHKLAFTGSVNVGRMVGKTAGKRILPVTLELGGKAPHIVFPDVDIDRAVENATLGYTFFNGESCILGTRLLIHEEIYDAFINKLIERAKEVKIGDPTDRSTRLGALINEMQGKKVLHYFDIAKEEGASILYGGNRVNVPGHEYGYFIEPTIIEAEPQMRIAQEEIFGPACTVTKWSEVDEVIKIANDVDYGLAAGIMTENLENALDTANKLEAGSVWINQYFNFQSGAPFGGYKNSGVGREYSKEALDSYTQSKTIVASYQLPPTDFFK